MMGVLRRVGLSLVFAGVLLWLGYLAWPPAPHTHGITPPFIFSAYLGLLCGFAGAWLSQLVHSLWDLAKGPEEPLFSPAWDTLLDFQREAYARERRLQARIWELQAAQREPHDG